MECHENFYDLHGRLVRCYEADILAMQQEVERLSNLLPPPQSSSTMPTMARHALLSSESRRSHAPLEPLLQPKSHTQPERSGSAKPPPEDDLNILDLGHAGGLWQSEAFQEDLQVCMLQKQEMELLMSFSSPEEKAAENQKGRVGTLQKSSEEGPARDGASLFRPRAVWVKAADAEEDLVRQRVSARTRRPSIRTTASIVHNDGSVTPGGRFAKCFNSIQHPGSLFRSWWGTFGMFLLTIDIVVVPLRVFDIGESVLLDVMFWVAHIYWNLAIPVSFVSGYDVEGILVLDLRKTFTNYAFSWFPFDLALVSLDWFLVAAFSSDSAGVARLSRTARSLRFLRLFRLGRVVKVGSIITSLRDQLTSRVANIQYSIFKLLLQLLLCNHIIACLWWLIGDQDAISGESESPNSWIVVAQLKDKPVAYQYSTSLHWAYAQLGVGQTEIEAVNLEERVFSVVISILALLNFSTMVSSMTSLLASLQKLKNEETEQFRLLRRYLSYNHIDPDLSHRVTRFLQHTFALKNQAISKDVHIPILDMLSKPLQQELQLQRHLECFNENDFIKKLLDCMDDQIYCLVCDLATHLKHWILAFDDVVFAAGSVATASYFIADGSCHYDSQAYPKSLKFCNLWMAEICLWAPWVHMGHLRSQDISRLIIIDVTTFVECCGKDPGTRQLASQYATEVVSRVDGRRIWSDLPLKLPTLDTFREDGAEATSRTARSRSWFGCCFKLPLVFSKVSPSP